MASLAPQRAPSPAAGGSPGRRAGPPNATHQRAARPHQQRTQTLNIKISAAAWAAELRADWQAFRLTARCPAGVTDEVCKTRFENAVADLLSGLQEDSGGSARTAGTFVSPAGASSRLVSIRLSATSQLWEELQRRMTRQGWVDLAPRGGRDPAWPGSAAVSTAATEGEREVALWGVPTGYPASALASRLREAGWPISRSFRPAHPTLGVKRDNMIAVLIPANFALPQTISLEVEGGDTFLLQVKPESKLPPAPRFPGVAANWAAVAGGGAPRNAPRPPPAAPPAGQAAPPPPAPAAAGAFGPAPAGAGGQLRHQRGARKRSRSRSRSQPGAGAAASVLARGRSRSRSPVAGAAGQTAADPSRGRSRSRSSPPAEGHVLPPVEQGASAAAGEESGGEEGFQQPKKPHRRSPGSSRAPSTAGSPPPPPNRFALLTAAAEVAAADGEAAADAMADA